MGSENEYEALHVMNYHVNHTGSDKKDPDNNAQFYLGICAVLFWSSLFDVSYTGHLFTYFAVEHVGFQSGHYQNLGTGQYLTLSLPESRIIDLQIALIQMILLIMSRFIWIYAVWHLVFQLYV